MGADAGLAAEVDDLRWAGEGEIELRLGLIDQSSGRSVYGVDARDFQFAEDGVDLGEVDELLQIDVKGNIWVRGGRYFSSRIVGRVGGEEGEAVVGMLGAAEGAGLGIRFLKHLQRTRLLLHLVDIAPGDGSSPSDAVRRVLNEVEKFGHGLAGRERWLVLSKSDLLDHDGLAQRQATLLTELHWHGPVFAVSSVSGHGLDALVAALARRLQTLQEAERRMQTHADADEDAYDPLK